MRFPCNGQIYTPYAIVSKAGPSGVENSAAYKQLTSGYAVPAHIGQGDTADFVVAAPDGMRQDLAYVTFTWQRGHHGHYPAMRKHSAKLWASLGIGSQPASKRGRAQWAAKVSPWGFRFDDHQLYQQFKQGQRSTQRPETMKQEITQDVRISQSGIS